MKKNIIIAFILFLSFFTIVNVDAAEVEITKENSYLLRDLIFEQYPTISTEEYPYFVTYEKTNKTGIWIMISSEGFEKYTTGVLNSLRNYKSYYFLDNILKPYNTSQVMYSNLYFSNIDILSEDGSILFQKNYPIEVEPTPTPTSSPVPDNPDTSELEKCDSIVCDITDTLLSDFNLKEFPFLEIIARFLIILLIDFSILSPLLIINRLLGRWIL